MGTLHDIRVDFQRLRKPATTLNADEQGVYAETYFLTAAKDALQFLRDCQGTVQYLGGPGSGLLRRVPLIFPEDDQLYAYRGEIEWLGADTKRANQSSYDQATTVFTKARIKIEFRTVPWVMGEDTDWISRSESAVSSMYTVPGRPLFFKSDNRRINHDAGIPVPEMDYNYTLHWLPDIDYARSQLLPLIGKANSTVFDDKFDAGTVIFNGYSSAGQLSTFGRLSQDLNLSFRWRSVPHDNAIRDDTGNWDQMVKSDGTSILEYADLNAIFSI